MRRLGFLAGLVALVVVVCASEAAAEREWAVTLLGRQYAGNKLLDFPDAFDLKDSYATGLSVSYQFVDWGPHMRWELEGQVLKHFGEQEHVELVASINVRWITFPWNRYLDTSFAFGGGLSQATEVPVLERRDPDSSAASALPTLPHGGGCVRTARLALEHGGPPASPLGGLRPVLSQRFQSGRFGVRYRF